MKKLLLVCLGYTICTIVGLFNMGMVTGGVIKAKEFIDENT